MRRVVIAALAAGGLAGCAGDNPDNVPEYGQWRMDTRLSSLTIDGQMVPASALPPEMQGLNTSQDICGEPMFIDRDWQQKDINRKVRGSCRLERYDMNGSQIRGGGMCTDIVPNDEFRPEFELTIDQAPASYRMNLTIKGMAKLPDGSRRFVKAIAIQDGHRTGDC